MEREGQIIACSALFPFFEDRCGEVAAIAVSPECRGQGQGDKLLGMSNLQAFVAITGCLCTLEIRLAWKNILKNLYLLYSGIA